MSDREALLTVVFARPADDAPRLVYADWLDEHGEPAQAASSGRRSTWPAPTRTATSTTG